MSVIVLLHLEENIVAGTGYPASLIGNAKQSLKRPDVNLYADTIVLEVVSKSYVNYIKMITSRTFWLLTKVTTTFVFYILLQIV